MTFEMAVRSLLLITDPDFSQVTDTVNGISTATSISMLHLNVRSLPA